jgi:hypothetical protein
MLTAQRLDHGDTCWDESIHVGGGNAMGQDHCAWEHLGNWHYWNLQRGAGCLEHDLTAAAEA